MNQTLVADYLLPALVADSLCLGAHWIYDPAQIAKWYPEGVKALDAPHSSYHPGKAAGDFTHYGDQTLALLRSVVKRSGFDAAGWKADWSAFWATNTKTYRDGATRETLEALVHGLDIGSTSHDLGGASRLAPLLAAHSQDTLEDRVQMAKAQTRLTHQSAVVTDAAALITHWVDGIQQGQSIMQSLKTAVSNGVYEALPVAALLNQATAAVGLSASEAGQQFGLSCNVNSALPLTFWLAIYHGDKPQHTLELNATLGGDSAARALVLGLILGAAHGLIWLPPTWRGQLTASQELSTLLGLDEAPTVLLA